MLWDYDALLDKSDDECCYSLSEREVQILMAQTDYIAWKTRYKPTSTEIDLNLLEQWQGNLARKLMSGCCPDEDKIYRFLPDGTLQSSTDGGVTWDDDPTADPRYHAPLAPPLSGADSDAKRCAAADNVRDQYIQMRENTIDLLTAGTTVLLLIAMLLGLVSGILAVTLTGAPFSVLLFSLAGILLSLTPESVAEQLDAEVMEQFKCLVYCRLGSDGRMTAEGLAGLLSDVATTFDDFPETFFYSITASLGATGLSNAATMGAATAADCGDCECVGECVDESRILIGNLASQTEFEITIEAVFTTHNGLPAYWVQYGSLTIGEFCCLLCDMNATPAIESSGYWECNGNPVGGSPINHEILMCEMYYAAPFEITFRFADLGGCD
jgi:hypothetical protein